MRAPWNQYDPEWRQLEIAEYIQAFKTSSDRARYVIYVNAVVGLLILVSTWNSTSWSWSGHTFAIVEKQLRQNYEEEFRRLHPPPKTATPTKIEPLRSWESRRDDAVRRRIKAERAEKYRDAALQRTWLIPVPGLGVDVDVRELSILGGVTLFVLSMLLCLSLVRQHENLYLALFKVRRLRERERATGHDGESMANFLYHALAMGQVLNHPPTLARWKYGFRNRLAGIVRWIVLMLPAIVQTITVTISLLALNEIQEEWGPKTVIVRTTVQVLLLIGIISACLIAAMYSRACNYRWRSTFDMLNPGLTRVEPRGWFEWLRITRTSDIGPPYLLSELTFSLQPDDIPETPGECTATAEVALAPAKKPRIRQKHLLEMARKIRDDAERQIGATNGVTYETWECTRNVIAGNTWFVEVQCRYLIAAPTSPPSADIAAASPLPS